MNAIRSTFLGAATVGLVIACQPDAVTNVPATATAPPQLSAMRHEAASCASTHNRAMRHVAAELRAYLRAGRRTRDDIISFARRTCAEFLHRNRFNGSCTFDQHRLESGGILRQLDARPPGAVRTLTPIAARRAISETGENYLNQLQWAVDDGVSAADVAARTQAIASDASNVLAGEELQVVLEIAAIADSSAHYWETEGQQWADITLDTITTESGGGDGGYQCPEGEQSCAAMQRISSDRNHLLMPTPPLFGWFSWRRCARWDVAGGIAGAIAGGQVLQGAIAGSVAEGVVQVLEKLESMM